MKANIKKILPIRFTAEILTKHSPETIANYLKFLIEVDRKSTPLKSLQGKIWQKGYESGELKSEVFEDVPRAFERWKSEDKLIAIYSSGSVLAQKTTFQIYKLRRSNYFYFRVFRYQDRS